MLSKRAASVTPTDIEGDLFAIAEAMKLGEASATREPDDPKQFAEALERLRLHLLDVAQAAAELGVDTAPIDTFLHRWHCVWKGGATFAQAAERIPGSLTEDVMLPFGGCMRLVQRKLRALQTSTETGHGAVGTKTKPRVNRTASPKTRYSHELTPQQKEASVLCARGFVRKEIADQMGITQQRVGQLLKAASDKISRLAGAARQSVRAGGLPEDKRGQAAVVVDERRS